MNRLDHGLREKFLQGMQDIEQFNHISGNFDKPVDTNLEFTMMKEELHEYYNACTDGDVENQMDALGDLFVVLWGTICKHGWRDKFPHILANICAANGSKFCATEAQAYASVQHYAQGGIDVAYEYNAEYQVYVIKDLDGKIRKGINFKKPDHSALILM